MQDSGDVRVCIHSIRQLCEVWQEVLKMAEFIRWSTICLLLAGCGSVEDFSEFDEFRFSSFGPFPSPGEVSSATVHIDGSGNYVLNVSTWAGDVGAEDDCLAGCLVEEPKEERILNTTESRAVSEAFRALYIETWNPDSCSQPGRILACLPTYSFTWDSYSVSMGVCCSPRITSDQAQDIIDLLYPLQGDD